MAVVSMKQLLEAGVHFGHPTRKWCPKMKKYIFTARNDIYILDLEKTVTLIDEAYAFVKSVVEAGGNILFVGTKNKLKTQLSKKLKELVCSIWVTVGLVVLLQTSKQLEAE